MIDSHPLLQEVGSMTFCMCAVCPAKFWDMDMGLHVAPASASLWTRHQGWQGLVDIVKILAESVCFYSRGYSLVFDFPCSLLTTLHAPLPDLFTCRNVSTPHAKCLIQLFMIYSMRPFYLSKCRPSWVRWTTWLWLTSSKYCIDAPKKFLTEKLAC